MQPLSGIRVLDLTRLLPGPWCTMLLGDLGAEVLKIENAATGGDITREALPRYGKDEDSVYFANVSRNKGSLLLNLKQDRDRTTFLELVKSADVVVENFRPGVADRLGVGYAACSARNADVIYCAISGYGQHGPRSALGGHDLNIAGMSGFLQSHYSVAPNMPSLLMGDYGGATAAATALCAAIAGRARGGGGSFIDVSMLEGLMSWSNIHAVEPFARSHGEANDDAIAGWGSNPRYAIYRARDGKYLTVSLLEKKHWDAFCKYVGRLDLINPDETEADRLTTHGERGSVYRQCLSELLILRDRDDWARIFRELVLPIFPVLSMNEVIAARSSADDSWFAETTLPSGRIVPQHGFPFRMRMADGTDALSIRYGPPARDDDRGMARRWLKQRRRFHA